MYVYAISHMFNDCLLVPVAPIKIGVSARPENRIKTLQTANPRPLMLAITIECESAAEARKVEKAFHGRYSGVRLEGEWFCDVKPSDLVRVAEEIIPRNFEYGVVLETSRGTGLYYG